MWGTGFFKGLGFTLKMLKEPKVTSQYPDEPIIMPKRFRGIQHFEPDLCIVCFQCSKICPTEVINLVGKPNPDPEKKGKVIDTYDINFEACILCDLCTEVCPTDAIQMTNNFELAVYDKGRLLKDKNWLEHNTKNIRGANK